MDVRPCTMPLPNCREDLPGPGAAMHALELELAGRHPWVANHDMATLLACLLLGHEAEATL